MTTLVGAPGRSLVPRAAAAAAAALLLTLVGTYLDTPFRSKGPQTWGISSGRSPAELLVLVLFALVGAALVFGLVVRPALGWEPGRTAVVAVVTAVVGILSIVVFWTGLPAIFALAAVLLAHDARGRLGSWPLAATVAIVLAVLTIAAAIGLAFAG